MSKRQSSRRRFLKGSLAAGGILAFPTIIPSRVLGQDAPSKKIQIAQIGCGRIAKDMDLPGVLKHDVARVVAVCDVDSNRMTNAKQRVEKYYASKKVNLEVKTFGSYRELLEKAEIDAVVISTPDHWHAEVAIAAALAGKDIFLQKPAAMTITEGRAMSDTVRAQKRIFQMGSQQRSMPQFRIACELVRNGRLGKLHTIKIGLPTDPAGQEEKEMPVPANLNYDMWLGSTPSVYYTENRVHPQKDYSRPGWLRCEAHCAGMITGWGSHHLDAAHWAMGTEETGPIGAEGTAEFPKSGLWNVHGKFKVELKYANGVTMIVCDEFTNGVRFEGEKGWIFVSRGNFSVTASDPTSDKQSKALEASDPKLLAMDESEKTVHLHKSTDHHGDWLEAIKTRGNTVAPAEVGHRSCSACLVAHAAMKTGRKLKWDPKVEKFENDEGANALLSRPQREPYGTEHLLKKV